jgi:hypothetical protein
MTRQVRFHMYRPHGPYNIILQFNNLCRSLYSTLDDGSVWSKHVVD